MAKFCANCGAQIAEGKKFCGSCGTKVEEQQIAQEQPPPPAEQQTQYQYQQPQYNAPQPQYQQPYAPYAYAGPIPNKKSKLPLILILAGVLLIGLIVLLIFVIIPAIGGKPDDSNFNSFQSRIALPTTNKPGTTTGIESENNNIGSADYVQTVKNYTPFEDQGFTHTANCGTVTNKYMESPAWNRRLENGTIYVDLKGKLKESGEQLLLTFKVTPLEGEDNMFFIETHSLNIDGDINGADEAALLLFYMYAAYDGGFDSVQSWLDAWDSNYDYDDDNDYDNGDDDDFDWENFDWENFDWDSFFG